MADTEVNRKGGNMGTVKKEMATHERVTKSNHRVNSNSNPSQCQLILDYLKVHKSITQWDALMEIGCMRLASRISELRKRGVPIITDNETRNGKTYARYRLGE